MHAPAAALSTNDNRPRSTRERIGTPRRPMGETERETATNEDAGRTLQVRRPARPSQRIAAGAHVPDGCGCHPFQGSEASPAPGGGARMRVLRCSLRRSALGQVLFALTAVAVLPATAQTDVVAGNFGATWKDVPEEHDGAGSEFYAELTLDEWVAVPVKKFREHGLTATGGTVTGVKRVTRIRRFPPGTRKRSAYTNHWRVRVAPDGDDSVTVTARGDLGCGDLGGMCPDSGNRLGEDVSFTVKPTESKDDLTAGACPHPRGKPRPRVCVSDAEASESDGVIYFLVTISKPLTDANKEVAVMVDTVPVTAVEGVDYAPFHAKLAFEAGKKQLKFELRLFDNPVDDTGKTFKLKLSDPYRVTFQTNGEMKRDSLKLLRAEGTGTIINSDPIPKAWTARFGRTIGAQVVEAIGNRVTAKGENHVRVGGLELAASGEQRAAWREPEAAASPWPGRELESARLDPRELALSSSFQIGEASDDGASGWSAWGQLARAGFEGTGDDVRVEGDVTTALVGADLFRDRWLAGLALGTHRGDGPFEPGEGPGGQIESSLTALYSYTRLSATERLDVWAIAGFGSGDLSVTEAGTDAIKTDLDMRMGALGARGALLDAGDGAPLDLALRSDAMFVEMRSDAAVGGEGTSGTLAATKARVSRLRLVLEGSRTFGVEPHGSVTPLATLGIRRDNGDAETGTGVEAGAGVRYRQPGVRVDASVRTLVSHDDDTYEEWGASAAVRIDPGASGRGLSLTLTPALGNATSRGEQLWGAADARGLASGGDIEASSRLDTEVGYGLGLAHGRGVLTPYAALGLGGSGSRTTRLGTRWDIGPEVALGVEASREQGGVEAPEHTLMLRAHMRF